MALPKKWLKITFTCPERITEAAADLLGVLSGSGVEVRPREGEAQSDVSGFFEFANEQGASGAAAETLRQQVTAGMRELFGAYGLSMPEPGIEILEDQDWATSWQQYFKPFEITPGLVIKPSWEDYAPTGGQQVLEMDPGMAFGTGQHESTRLALALIAECCRNAEHPVNSVLDVGTGTGILAMAAALFGAQNVTAIDNDPEAVRVAAANISHNSLAGTVLASEDPLERIQGPFDLICANIIHDVLLEMAPEFQRLLAPGGHVVLAGILAGAQEESIARLYGQYGMRTTAARVDGEWAGLLLQRTSS